MTHVMVYTVFATTDDGRIFKMREIAATVVYEDEAVRSMIETYTQHKFARSFHEQMGYHASYAVSGWTAESFQDMDEAPPVPEKRPNRSPNRKTRGQTADRIILDEAQKQTRTHTEDEA